MLHAGDTQLVQVAWKDYTSPVSVQTAPVRAYFVEHPLVSTLLYCEWLQSVDLPSSAHPFVRGL